MTDREWNESSDPARMLRIVERTADEGLVIAIPRRVSFRVSDRKLRLFACACARQAWHLLADERSRRAVEVAERVADGLATADEWELAVVQASEAYRTVNGPIGQHGKMVHAAAIAANAVWNDISNNIKALVYQSGLAGVDAGIIAALLRDIIGNPFRPIIVNEGQHALTTMCGIVLDRRWLTPTVVSLATAAYSERGRVCKECAGRGTVFICDPNDAFAAGAVKCSACHGTGRIENGLLDNDRLGVLADCLEDEGCNSTELLAHLRSIGPHVLGCWAIDSLLGKS